eukprot:9211593-Pyramimonas_sp.AAC.1
MALEHARRITGRPRLLDAVARCIDGGPSELAWHWGAAPVVNFQMRSSSLAVECVPRSML